MVDRAGRFDDLYASDIDPWKFRSSDYERSKYEATLAALPRERYAACIEAGCSIGELTRLLASRCESVTGIDISHVAISEAERRNADLPDVQFIRAEFPESWPEMPADLIVLSEILYFLTPDEIVRLADVISRNWTTPGDCVLVNYLGQIPEPLQGDDAADCFIKAIAHTSSVRLIDGNGYRIDVLMKR
jgi:trans-aconitate methyltransferase